ncbi:MAG: DUF4058 family protein [Pirellulaceae bacterium]|nr:DUF4058 family protein [Pirellulaceae bacterium]
MPSPFPGMNPYLEQEDAWRDFHEAFLPAAREALSPQVSPSYLVKLEQNLYIHERAADERHLLGYGDVTLSQTRRTDPPSTTGAVLTSPRRILLPRVDVESESYIEIRDAKTRRLVTVIELLSPTNKRPGDDRQRYLTKRTELLRSDAHFVELDLLRGWPRMPFDEPPTGDYCVLVSRVEDRPRAEFWPIGLRDRLPEIPIPLQSPHPDARLDLQAVLHRVYDAAYYRDYIYDGTPWPSLSNEDADWAQRLAATGS